MSSPPSYDQDLLARLNALKRSNISLDVKPSLGISKDQEQSPEMDLSARLRSLRNGGAAPSNTSNSASTPQSSTTIQTRRLLPTGVADVNDYTFPNRPSLPSTDLSDDETRMSSISGIYNPSREWTIPSIDSGEVGKLFAAAGKIKAESRGKANDKAQGKDEVEIQSNASDQEISNSDADDSEVEGTADSLEVEEILERLADELELEAHEVAKEQEQDQYQQKGVIEDDQLTAPSYPIGPESTTVDQKSGTKSPNSRTRRSLDSESDISARLAALSSLNDPPTTLPATLSFPPLNSLGLPSVPPHLPSHSAATSSAPKLIEDWCVICQDDATIYCHGCADEAGPGLYCALCWKEGHMGPEAGPEEKRHEWSKYMRLR